MNRSKAQVKWDKIVSEHTSETHRNQVLRSVAPYFKSDRANTKKLTPLEKWKSLVSIPLWKWVPVGVAAGFLAFIFLPEVSKKRELDIDLNEFAFINSEIVGALSGSFSAERDEVRGVIEETELLLNLELLEYLETFEDMEDLEEWIKT